MTCRLELLFVVVLSMTAPALAEADQPVGAAAPSTAGRPGRSDDVPPEVRQAVTDRFARGFLLPNTVMWKFDYTQPYPTGGLAVCGRVNYQNSTRRYVGEQPFFARLQDGRVIQSGIVARSKIEDPVHANANAFAIACGDN